MLKCGQQIKVNRQQVKLSNGLCKVFCNHCCAGKYMNSSCDTYLCTDLYFYVDFFMLLCHYFTPIIRVLVIDTIIGRVNIYLVKTN